MSYFLTCFSELQALLSGKALDDGTELDEDQEVPRKERKTSRKRKGMSITKGKAAAKKPSETTSPLSDDEHGSIENLLLDGKTHDVMPIEDIPSAGDGSDDETGSSMNI